jgi:hypothetical protein
MTNQNGGHKVSQLSREKVRVGGRASAGPSYSLSGWLSESDKIDGATLSVPFHSAT